MITSIARWFGVGTAPRKRSSHKASLKDLAGIRNHLLQAIEDCLDQQALRLRQKIRISSARWKCWPKITAIWPRAMWC